MIQFILVKGHMIQFILVKGHMIQPILILTHLPTRQSLNEFYTIIYYYHGN
jgi:hypothetical protein